MGKITKDHVIMVLCDRLDEDIYLPMKELLERHDIDSNLGNIKERFKLLIESSINSIGDEFFE